MLVHCLRSCLPALLVVGPLLAADAPPAPLPATAPVPAPAPTPVDPTDVVVAQGALTYHQRDVDALALVADRYVSYHLTPAEEDQLRKALARLLVAREPLVQALQAIPPALVGGKSGDAFLLDVLDYRPEPDGRGVVGPAAQPGPAPRPEPAGAAAADNSSAPGAAAPGTPVIVALPPLTETRTIGGEKRQLVLGIALCFADDATSQRFQLRAPIIRDTILGALEDLPDSAFSEPKQIAIKRILQTALAERLADFPKDGVLIPQLDVGPVPAAGAAAAPAAAATAPTEPAPATPTAPAPAPAAH